MRALLVLTLAALAVCTLAGRPRPPNPGAQALSAVAPDHSERYIQARVGLTELSRRQVASTAATAGHHEDEADRESHDEHQQQQQQQQMQRRLQQKQQDVREEVRTFAQAMNATDLTEVNAVEVASEGRVGAAQATGELGHLERHTLQHRVSTLTNQAIVFSGATGINGVAINGRYIGTGNLYNGKPLYQKEVDPDRWLRYVTANGLNQWRISSTPGLTANNDKGYAYSLESGLEDPSRASVWYVWDGSRWTAMESIQVREETMDAAKAAASGEVYAAAVPAQDRTVLGVATAALSWIFWHVAMLIAIIVACGLLYALHVKRRDDRNLLPIWAAGLDVPGKIRRLSDVVRSFTSADH